MGEDGREHPYSVWRSARRDQRWRAHARQRGVGRPSVIRRGRVGCVSARWIMTRRVIALCVCGVQSACAFNGLGTSLRREYDAGALRLVEWRSAGVIVWVTPEERSLSVGVQRRWAAYTLRHHDRCGGGRERDAGRSACPVARDVATPSRSGEDGRALVAMGRDGIGACGVMGPDAVGVGLGLMKWVGMYVPMFENRSRATGYHKNACGCARDCKRPVLLVWLDSESAQGCGGVWVAVDGVFGEGE